MSTMRMQSNALVQRMYQIQLYDRLIRSHKAILTENNYIVQSRSQDFTYLPTPPRFF